MKCIYVDRECVEKDCIGFIVGNDDNSGECVFTLNAKIKFFASIEQNVDQKEGE